MVAEPEADLLEDGPVRDPVGDALKTAILAVERVAGVLAHPYEAI
jgi:hypothetical protein